jgi:hypothetical protein
MVEVAQKPAVLSIDAPREPGALEGAQLGLHLPWQVFLYGCLALSSPDSGKECHADRPSAGRDIGLGSQETCIDNPVVLQRLHDVRTVGVLIPINLRSPRRSVQGGIRCDDA